MIDINVCFLPGLVSLKNIAVKCICRFKTLQKLAKNSILKF